MKSLGKKARLEQAAFSRAPLGWTATMDVEFAKRVLANLSAPTLQEILQYLRRVPAHRWGTACSGSESPSWALKALWEAVSTSYGQEVGERADDPFEHVYAAESEPTKREWISQKTVPLFLFSDIFDLTRVSAYCDLAGKDVKVVEVGDIDQFIAGFSCKNVSGLSNDDEGRRAAISEYRGSTGWTWWGVVLVVQKQRPKCFVLENVEGLMWHGGHLLVVAKLRSLGYVVIWRLSNALDCGVPQNRSRIWFVGWRRDLIVDVESFTRLLEQTMEECFNDHPMMSLDDALLPEDHPFVLEADDVAGASSSMRSPPSTVSLTKTKGMRKWVDKARQREKKQTRHLPAHTHWRPELECVYPAYKKLPERCRQLLDGMDVRFPEVVATIVRLDQSEAGKGVDQIPCITPSGMFWAAHQCRLLQGYELMRLQGFVLADSDLDKWPSRFLQDLAGNSFCVFSGLVFILVGVTGLAAAAAQRKLGADLIRSLQFVPGMDESDSDGE